MSDTVAAPPPACENPADTTACTDNVVETPATPPPEPTLLEPPPSSYGNSFLVFGDTQLPHLQTHTAIRSSTVNTESPSVRLPASEIAVPMIYYHLAQQYNDMIPASYAGSNLGGLYLGDLGDTAAKPELAYVRAMQERIERAFPRQRLFTIAPGNHDAFPNGTFNTGSAFFFLGLFLDVETISRSYLDDVAAREAGGRDNLVNKKDFLKFSYETQRIPFRPIAVPDADTCGYTIKGGEEVDWDETKKAFDDFWKPVGGGNRWNVLVQYDPDDASLKTEEQWLTLDASLVNTYDVAGTKVPVYMITLDTIDFIGDSSTNGAIQGHISFLQTRLVAAFMKEMKSRNPNAKFILASHFPLDDIDEPWSQFWSTLFSPTRWFKSGNDFDTILEDESVIAALVAHSHRWDYKDLNSPEMAEELDIDGRKTPLPQISVASLIDHPIGAATFNIRPEGNDLVLDYRKIGIDPERILQKADPAVRQEVERHAEHLVTYIPALKNLLDDFFKFLGHPEGELVDKIPVLLDFDFGKLYEAGRINDHLIAQDTIFLMVETAKEKLRLYFSSLKLALMDAGLGEEAKALDEVLWRHLATLENYYRTILKNYAEGEVKGLETRIFRDSKRFQKTTIASSPEESLRIIDEQREALGVALLTALQAIRLKRGNLTPGTTEYDVLDRAGTMIGDLDSLLSRYKEWLKNFEGMMVYRRPAKDVATLSNLMDTAEWARMEQNIRGLPFTGSAASFLTVAGIRSAELRNQFLRKATPVEIPDRIEVRVNIKSDKVQLTKPPPRPTDDQLKKKTESLPRPPNWGPETLEAAKGRLTHPSFLTHFSLRGGVQGPRIFRPNAFWFQAGGQWHWFPKQNGYLRLTGVDTLELKTTGPHGTELGFSAAFLADLMGNVALGPAGGVGLAFGNVDGEDEKARPAYSVGGELSLFEGIANFRALHTWYGDRDDTGFVWMAGTDLFTIARALDLWPRHR